MNRTGARPSLSELEAVSAVARTQSFRGAARALGASPSALSHAISSLEARLGVRLFQRSTRSVRLTDEGAAFVAHASEALAVIDRAVDDATARSGVPNGTLRIVSPRGPAWLTILPVVLEMRRRYAEVTVELITETRMRTDLIAEGFDAGVRYAGLASPDMIAVPCSQEVEVAIVGAPKYLRGRSLPASPKQLPEHECVRYRKDGSPVNRWLLRIGGKDREVDVQGHLVLDDEAFLLDAALDGAGLVYLTRTAAAPHISAKRLTQVLERYTPKFAPLQLVYPARRQLRPALRAFIALVKERSRTAAPDAMSPG